MYLTLDFYLYYHCTEVKIMKCIYKRKYIELAKINPHIFTFPFELNILIPLSTFQKLVSVNLVVSHFMYIDHMSADI